jgi:thiol-disulfide isomerase/thioredoxin
MDLGSIDLWMIGANRMSLIPVGFKIARSQLIPIMLAVFILMTITASALAEDWSSYKPAFAPGQEENDWWTQYPSQSPRAGASVEHPSWVTDALKDKPIIILDHSSNCKSCVVQKANMEKVMAEYGKDVAYYDINADGDDQRAFEILGVYGLTGLYVPTTVFITLQKGADGNVGIAWHSVEDAMSEEQVTDYVKDAIYYHQENAANWS